MSAFCPFERQMCFDRCALYDNGCLVRQALKAYVILNTPIVCELNSEPRSEENWAGQMSFSSQWGDR